MDYSQPVNTKGKTSRKNIVPSHHERAILLQAAHSAKEKNNFALVSELYGKSYAKYGDLEDLVEEIKAYIRMGLFSTAEYKIQQSIEKTDLPGFVLLDAYVKVQQNKYQKATDLILQLFSSKKKIDYAQAFFILLTGLNGLEDFERSVRHAKFAIQQFSNDERILSLYCEALAGLRCFDEIINILEPRLQSNQLSEKMIFQLATAYSSTHKDPNISLNLYNKFEQKYPGNPIVNWNKSLTLLKLGHIKEGWESYTRRWEWTEFPSPNRKFKKPKWTYGKNNGKVLLWTEQGIGDELRFLSLLQKFENLHGNDIILEVQPKFLESYKRSFPNIEVRSVILLENLYSPKEDFDSHLPIGDLPYVLGLYTREEFTSKDYIKTDKLRDFFWQDKLKSFSSKPKVGLAWRSKITKARSQWYTDINYWRKLIMRDDISVVSLQYDDISEDIANADKDLIERLYFPNFLDQMDDLDGAFSLIKNLDFVLTPHTSVAVMASAVGVPTISYGPMGPISFNPTTEIHKFPWHENHWYIPITDVANNSHIFDSGLHIFEDFIIT